MKKTTRIIMMVATVLLLGYNIVVAIFFEGATISEQIVDFSTPYKIIPFAFGVLGGHWFLKFDLCLRMRARFPWLPLVQLAVAPLSMLLAAHGALALGLISGAALWSMPPGKDIDILRELVPDAYPYKLTTKNPKGMPEIRGDALVFDNIVIIEGRKYARRSRVHPQPEDEQ